MRSAGQGAGLRRHGRLRRGHAQQRPLACARPPQTPPFRPATAPPPYRNAVDRIVPTSRDLLMDAFRRTNQRRPPLRTRRLMLGHRDRQAFSMRQRRRQERAGQLQREHALRKVRGTPPAAAGPRANCAGWPARSTRTTELPGSGHRVAACQMGLEGAKGSRSGGCRSRCSVPVPVLPAGGCLRSAPAGLVVAWREVVARSVGPTSCGSWRWQPVVGSTAPLGLAAASGPLATDW
jgi:hypothetical protein